MTTTKEAGRMGAAVRHNKPLEERQRIAARAAATRKARQGEKIFKIIGQKGGLAAHKNTTRNEREKEGV